ncbi:hypothetical protein KP509_22G002500 [Ceratopteris richardii]|uniref:EF-hand domain-containing protein n=1 Tax=Ceratopteris richardii TaxID=49495 RepID=A0A8T2S5D7_CERRI|nr:hypothetical protein KP509_22G002500 [Ceratopteris richardii]
MASACFDQEQVEELKEIFRMFDKDGDDSLTELQLGSLLRALGLMPNQQELEALLHRADTNSNGLIDFQDFVNLIEPGLNEQSHKYGDEQLRALFYAFDEDGNGFITASELEHSMLRLGYALTPAELSEMMEEADFDGDGRISYEEFVLALTTAAFDVAKT